MKTFKAKCGQCGRQFRRTTRAELLQAMHKHQWKEHRAWMITRIKAGRRNAELDNPSIQDLMQAVSKGSSRAGIAVAKLMTEQRYQQVKKVMDAVQPMLPLKGQLAWEGIEAAHDIYKKAKRR
ncbi:hypothetical protein ES708_28769 [subsurface metagenome]